MQLSNIAAGRYSRRRMHTIPSSLLSRLRPRLAAAAWLFALLVMAKATLAAACFNDAPPGLPSSNGEAFVSSSISPASSHADVVVSATLESGDDACWHDGTGGCHCACAHAAPIAGTGDRIAAVAPLPAEFAAVPAFPVPARREPALRPPIA